MSNKGEEERSRKPTQDTEVFRITLSKKPETLIEHGATESDEASSKTKQVASKLQVKTINIQPKYGGTDSAKHRRLFTQVHSPQRDSNPGKNFTLGSEKEHRGKFAGANPQTSSNSLDEGMKSRLAKNNDEDPEPQVEDFLLECIQDVDPTILKIQGPYRPLGMITSSSKNSLFTTSPTSLVPFVKIF